jgi:hypothetical protein
MFNGNSGPFEATGTSTFPTHQFFFLKPKTLEVVCTFPITKGTSVYYCNPFEETDPNDPSSGLLSSDILDLDILTEEEREFYDALVFNREFAGLYKNFTGGSEWLGLYPTKPPKHHMWRADYMGQTHQIQTKETQFVQLPPADDLRPMSYTKMKRNKTDPLPLSEYREPGLMNITIKAISCAPRIFQIDNVLSEVEVDQ